MTEYFYNFIFNNKQYVLFKIQLIGSISFNCLEKNDDGKYDLSKFNIEGRWKWIAPGGLVKEWLLYTCLEFIDNSNLEIILQLIGYYDKIIPLPYEIIDSIIVK
jgi:hypothetical protein